MKKKIFISLLLIMFILTGCKKELPYGEVNKLKISKPDTEFTVPVYYYTSDGEGNIKKIDGVEFLKKELKYIFKDWKIEDKKDKQILTFACEQTGELEFNTTSREKWSYSVYHSLPFTFDYYTGIMYREKRISTTGVNSNMRLLDGDEAKLKYTNIKFNNNDLKIGVLMDDKFDGWKENNVIDRDRNHYHASTPIKFTVLYTIEIPKNYDGVMLAINKEGSTEEGFNKNKEEENKIKELQAKEKETGKKSKELEKVKKEKYSIHKIVDPNDKKRKDVKFDDYYFVRISDALNLKYVEKVDYTPLIIGIVVGILIISSTVIVIILVTNNKKKEKKKEESKPTKKLSTTKKKTNTKKTKKETK